MNDLLDSFQAYLGLALTVLTLASLAGVGSLIGNVRNLREQVNDADKEAERFRKSRDEERAERQREKAALLAERAADRQLVTECQAEIEVLRRTVTGEVHWVALGEQLSALADHLARHAEALDRLEAAAIKHWQAETEALAAIRRAQEGR